MATRQCPKCGTAGEDWFCRKCSSFTRKDKPAQNADPMVGSMIDGRYRIETLLGRGGMGKVYRGVQVATGQVVAVKVIPQEHLRDELLMRRFRREAEVVATLSHPNIIRLVDFGKVPGGQPYLVMEYVEGETLAQRVFKSGPVAEGRLAAIAAQMAHGLAEAHRQGVLHRDLKPDNVLLLNAYGHTDFVKIIDFGVAKMMRSPGPTRPLTATDEIIGTAEYMAPEQAACRRSLTGAADVYSLGLTVWFALAAEDPFGGVNRMESMMARFRQSSPPLPANRSASPAMRDLLNNLMAMEPVDRPLAEQAALAFEALRDGAG